MIRVPVSRAASLGAAIAVPMAAGSLLMMATPAAAVTVSGAATIAVPGATASGVLRAGGPSTPFTLALPANASCSADTAHHGYHVYSYVVPKGTDLAAVRFIDFPSEGFGLDSSGRYYGAVNTALGTGQIIGIPNDFEWGPLVSSALPMPTLVGGSSHGVWEAGIACANSRGVLTNYWNTQVTFTANDGAGFTWQAVPGGSAGSASLPTASAAAGTGRAGPRPAASTPAPATAGSSGAAGRFADGSDRGRSVASGATSAPSVGGTTPDGAGGSSAVSDLTAAAAVGAGAFALAVGVVLLVLFRRNSRHRSASAAGSWWP